MAFFKYYGYSFAHEKFAIDIRSGIQPYPPRYSILANIKQKF